MKTIVSTVYEYKELGDEARKRVTTWLGREMSEDEVASFLFHEDGAIADDDPTRFQTLHIDLNALDLPNSFIIPMDTINKCIALFRNADDALEEIEELIEYTEKANVVTDMVEDFISKCLVLGNKLQLEVFADLAQRIPPLVVVDKRKEA